MCRFRLLLTEAVMAQNVFSLGGWPALLPLPTSDKAHFLAQFFLGIYLSAHLSSTAPLSRQTTCELCSAIFTSTLPSEMGKAKNQQMELFAWLQKHPGLKPGLRISIFLVALSMN